MLQIAAGGNVPGQGKILFVARLQRPAMPERIAAAVGFLAPPLTAAGFEVFVSTALAHRLDTEEVKGFRSRTLEVLNREIEQIQPDFVAFPIYDSNAEDVLNISQGLAARHPQIGLVFGGPFITIVPRVSKIHFGAFSNVVMIRGEAELALPQALLAFQQQVPADSPGIYVRRGGTTLVDNFDRSVSLTAEEHENLEFAFDVHQERIDGSDPLRIPLMSSRGCFMGCSYCAASSALRARFVAWSPRKRLQMVAQSLAWARAHGFTGRVIVDFSDDDFTHRRGQAAEFLDLFRRDKISREVELDAHVDFSDFLDSDDQFNVQLADALMDDSGRPLFESLHAAVDFWDEAGRRRNRGGREGRLRNEQIHLVLSELAGKRQISIATNWLWGDEQTSLDDFVKGVLFLGKLMLDFGPRFRVSKPHRVIPLSGTQLRSRLERAQREQGGPYLFAYGLLSDPEAESGAHPFYSPLPPANSGIVRKVIKLLLPPTDDTSALHPANILHAFLEISKIWKSPMTNAQLVTLTEILAGIQTYDDLVAFVSSSDPRLKTFPEGGLTCEGQSFNVGELLGIAWMSQLIPPYYESTKSYYNERDRRR